jgi:PPOX class probable F420-dependent enzyme
MRERLRAARAARLATVTPEGRPHVVVCCFALVGETVYSAVDAKPKSTFALRRLDNVRAHPFASLLVDHYDEDWSTLWWVRADCEARLLDRGEERDRAITALIEKYEQYRASPPPGAVIALDVRTWRAWP